MKKTFKKAVAVFLAAVFFLVVIGCGNDKVINGKEYKTVGVISVCIDDPTLFDVKDPKIKYQVIWGNAVLGCLLFGTVIAPIYFFGFSLFEPVSQIPQTQPQK